jgi:hypothetical protein
MIKILKSNCSKKDSVIIINQLLSFVTNVTKSHLENYTFVKKLHHVWQRIKIK